MIHVPMRMWVNRNNGVEGGRNQNNALSDAETVRREGEESRTTILRQLVAVLEPSNVQIR